MLLVHRDGLLVHEARTCRKEGLYLPFSHQSWISDNVLSEGRGVRAQCRRPFFRFFVISVFPCSSVLVPLTRLFRRGRLTGGDEID
jgi:hypothetical protein